MALDQLSSSTYRNLIPVLVDNVFRGNPLMVLLIRKTVKVDGGTTFTQPIRPTRGPTGSSYQGADVLNLVFDNNIIGAEWNWAQYGRLLGVTGFDELRNSGPRAILNTIKINLEAMEMELREDMGTDLYLDGTANANKAFTGLAAAVDDGTNVVTYGNVSRTNYPNWKATLSANGGVGRALTLKLLNTNFDNVSKGSDRPTLIMVTHGIWQKYLELLQPFVRLGDQQAANMGFQNVMFLGRPMIVDEAIPTTGGLHKAYLLNMKYFTFYTSVGRSFLFVPFQQLPLQDAAVAKVLWAGQLICSSPRMQCGIVDVDVSL